VETNTIKVEGKNILITGANRGIGFETARQLGKKGFHILISGRNEDRLETALGKLREQSVSAEILVMDVSQDDSVKMAAYSLSQRQVKLDVIINNAGILLREDRLLTDLNLDVVHNIINTNCYGPLRVVQFFLHLMNKPGRIINISSGGGSMSDPVGGWSPAYCTSKTLLNSITRHLAYELTDKRISVNAVCPGWVQTDMGGKSAPRSVEKGAETPAWLASEASLDLTGKIFRDKHEIAW
jgi:NAD(P)-dependent dehydrogenase (short-subunit alcohol dehydrogenase family)